MNMGQGICALTKTMGPFVKAHLLPQALTKLNGDGSPLVESGSGRFAKRAWSSWYDSNLVTNDGEQILSKFDSWGVAELRRLKLVWSGWGPMTSLGVLHEVIPDTDWGYRKVSVIDPIKLRMFFLSLLWRAAASSRPEFEQIDISATDIERLRQILTGEAPDDLDFYTCTLTQISTRGFPHNHTPIREIKTIPSFDGSAEVHIPIARFYFDGLIAHFHLDEEISSDAKNLGPLNVGQYEELVVSTVSYETSKQLRIMAEIMGETISR
jgi:hypothetical protein